jgi:hypothetical protein
MATSKGGSKANQAASYKANKRWESNRKRRLERTLKAQPTNQQVINALKVGMVYRRKTPTNPTWSSSWIRVAKIMKEFTGRFDPVIMGSNIDAAKVALSRQGPVAAEMEKTSKFKAGSDKGFFTLETRLFKGLKA